MNQIEYAFDMLSIIHVKRASKLKYVLSSYSFEDLHLKYFKDLLVYEDYLEKLIPDTIDVGKIREVGLVFEQKTRLLLETYASLNDEATRRALEEIESVSVLYLREVEHVFANLASSILALSPPVTKEQLHLYRDYTKTMRLLLQTVSLQKIERSFGEEQSPQINKDIYRDVLKQAPVGMLLINREDLVVEFVSDMFMNIVGASMDIHEGEKYINSIGKLTDFFVPIILDVLNTGFVHYEYDIEVPTNRFGDEEISYYNFILQPYRERSGDITKVILLAIETTEQVKIKRNLLRSESQFRQMVKYSQFAKAIIRRDGFKIEIANDTILEKFWGKALDQVVGQNLFDVFPELKYQKFCDELNQVFQTGETCIVAERYLSVRDGNGEKNYFFDYQFLPLFETNGEISDVMLSLNDVTVSVESKSLMKEIVDRLHLATAGALLGTFDLDLFSRKIIYTDRFNEIIGAAEGSRMSYEEILKLVHPEDKQSILAVNIDFSLKGDPVDFELRIYDLSGKILWIRLQGQVVFNDSKQPWRFVGTVMDVTERKYSELAVIRSEGKFRTLAEAMPQFIWTCDKYGRFDYISQSFFDYIGIDSSLFNTDSWFDRIHKEDQDTYYWKWKNAIHKEHPFECEVRFRRSDGEFRWYLCIGISHLDADGKIEMWIGSCTDIHQSKTSIDNLELEVQKRTQELMEVNEQLIKTNIELGQFAHVASHDLQEPLRKIQTFAGRILETEFENLTEKGKDYFVRMQGASIRMKQLIIDLLAFTRVNVGEGAFEKTDLNIVINNIKEELSEKISQKQVNLKFDNLPQINVISFQIEQLLTNLISNSIKFTLPGRTPEIIISAGKIAGNTNSLKLPLRHSDYYFISVKDNGIGFDMAHKHRIFQVFQRLHTKQQYEGTGIGLSICKKIVDNHGGTIDVISEEGMGTTISIYIPIKRNS